MIKARGVAPSVMHPPPLPLASGTPPSTMQNPDEGKTLAGPYIGKPVPSGHINAASMRVVLLWRGNATCLGAVGVLASVCHGKLSRLVVLQCKAFVRKLGT